MSAMVAEPVSYFGRLIPARSDLLKQMEKEAAAEKIPIVGPVVGELLYLLARLQGSRHVLELGTAIGYSAIYLGQACLESGGRLTTFEVDEAMIHRARDNIRAAELEQVVNVQHVDALKGLTAATADSDFIFMDIEKRDYVRALTYCKNRLRPGGLLVADNTAFLDADDFNKAVHDDPDWRAVNFYALLPGHSPANDGLCLALMVRGS